MGIVNNCSFIGHVTQAPALQSTNDGTVARFQIVVHEHAGKDDHDQAQEPAQWIPVVALRGLADRVRALHRGDHVSITGRWSQREQVVELMLEDFRRLAPRPRPANKDAEWDFADE